MRPLIVSAVGLCALLASGVCAYLARPVSIEGLVAKEPLRDLGVLPQGIEARAEFTLVNRSTDTIAIDHILKDCDCVGATVVDPVLAPGQATTIAVRWETGKKRGPASSDLVVAHNSASTPGVFEQTRLRIAATVEPDYDCEPDSLGFDAGRDGASIVRFRPGRLPAFRLLGAVCNHGAFSAELRPDDSILVSFDHAAWADARRDGPAYLIVSNNSEAESEFHLPLHVSGGSSPEAEPSVGP